MVLSEIINSSKISTLNACLWLTRGMNNNPTEVKPREKRVLIQSAFAWHIFVIFNALFLVTIYCPRKGDIASHEIGRKELKFFVFSSALPKSFFSFLASLTARGENHRGRVLLEKYRADVDM